jgi:hypothetical protein
MGEGFRTEEVAPWMGDDCVGAHKFVAVLLGWQILPPSAVASDADWSGSSNVRGSHKYAAQER